MRIEHGGDLYGREDVLDFSVSLNPLGIPTQIKLALLEGVDSVSLLGYPDTLCRDLKSAIATKYQVDEELVICGNGASSLITLAIWAIRPKKVLLPVPIFGGYERALAPLDTELRFHILSEEQGFCLTEEFLERLYAERPKLVVLCNPCNPTGKRIEPSLLQKIIDWCKENECYLLIDECFVGFVQGKCSVRKQVKDNPYLLVLDAFTKLYGMPGIRLGFMFVSNASLREKITLLQPEWSVSGFAQLAGVLACAQTEYEQISRNYLEKERAYLQNALRDKGMQVFDTEVNFILFKGPIGLQERLLEKRILIRDCSNFRGLSQGFYRVAVRSRKENDRLLEAL